MKKPLLGPCDSYQLEPFIYEWAWKMARNQENNTWSPEEIQVSYDIADYKDPQLDPKYKHLFEAVMAQLTTFDIERGDDAAETFLAVLQPAEIRHYIKRLVWDEALHTRSYRYIIENLGIPLSIYDRWKEVPVMKERVLMAQHFSEPIEKLIGQHLLHGIPYDQVFASTQYKQKLAMSMIFWGLIFEGVWFWMNLLGPIQQLARLGTFKGAAEQFTYIARDEQSHISFMSALIREFIAQHPEINTKSFRLHVNDMVYGAIGLETEFMEYCLKDGPIMGYSVVNHSMTAKYFANTRLSSIGFDPVYSPEEAQHQFPWMAEQMEIRKEKNFFETRVTEYQTGGALSFDSDDEDDWQLNM